MSLIDPDGLQSLVRKEPVEVLRRCLKLHRGKASSTQVKEQLNGKIIQTKAWNSWWKKAKAAAVEDPLILVEGSSARPVFTLRKKALTLEEEARWTLRHETSVQALIRGLRCYLDRCTRESDREALIQLAEERLGPDAAADSSDPDRIGALVFLEDLGRGSAEEIDRILRDYLGLDEDGAAVEPTETRPHRMVFALAALEDAETRLRVVRRVKSLGGPHWHHIVAQQLKFLPEDCQEEFIELMAEEDTAELLASTYESVAPFPKKHPLLIYLLTKAYAEGRFDGSVRTIDRAVICRVIMHTLRVVQENPKSAPGRSRLLNRIVTLLVGKRELLADLLSSVDSRTMETLRRISARVRGFPNKVQEVLDRTATQRFPELMSKGDRPFWENQGTIFCTRKGFDSHQKEFLHLRDVKIPENSEAIGAAASQGDLSENAEWEVAVEEQRNLTSRAAHMEDELRRAKVLDDQEIPAGLVAPGTRVRFLDLDTEEETEMRVLGPWDGVLGDDVVSYR
ncbi:MAG: hypothetical protein ACE5F1_22435, partial [Planctomycetota bacterium]